MSCRSSTTWSSLLMCASKTSLSRKRVSFLLSPVDQVVNFQTVLCTGEPHLLKSGGKVVIETSFFLFHFSSFTFPLSFFFFHFPSFTFPLLFFLFHFFSLIFSPSFLFSHFFFHFSFLTFSSSFFFSLLLLSPFSSSSSLATISQSFLSLFSNFNSSFLKFCFSWLVLSFDQIEIRRWMSSWTVERWTLNIE